MSREAVPPPDAYSNSSYYRGRGPPPPPRNQCRLLSASYDSFSNLLHFILQMTACPLPAARAQALALPGMAVDIQEARTDPTVNTYMG